MITHNQNERLWDLIKNIRAGMLVTRNGFLHGRPMALLQKEFDGTLYFFTSKSSPKTHEIEHDPEVCVTFADDHSMTYVSMTGTAKFNEDTVKIEELWSPMSSAWFDGKDDPDLVVLEVKVERAEYWDSKSNRMTQIYEVIKAHVTGAAPNLGENRKLN